MADYYRTLTEITEIPAPDELIQGSYSSDVVALGTPGDYKRGMLLMSGENGFVPATSAALAGADEVCICAENISFTEGTAASAAYFTGTFSPQSIILDWEQEGDDHSELIEAIRPELRRRKIFMN